MSSEQSLYVIAHREKLRQDDPMVDVFGRLKQPDYYKIGIATNVEKRLSILSGGTPHELELITTLSVDDAETVERHLHRYAGGYDHDRGEWFRLSINMVNSLRALDHLEGQNVKEVVINSRRFHRRESFYVRIHRARRNELPTLKEMVANE
jgi:hypothetical protein